MDKKSLSESDICDKFIRPAMERAGWHGIDQISREFPLRAGRVVVRGKSTVLRADYALFYKANIPLAVVEAEDNRPKYVVQIIGDNPEGSPAAPLVRRPAPAPGRQPIHPSPSGRGVGARGGVAGE